MSPLAYDPETWLRYYRARYYDPTIGRFVSEDPAAFAATINFYPYVGNSPANFTDPLGLQSTQGGPSPIAAGGGPFICLWCGEFDGGVVAMWEGFQRMKQHNWKNSDLYYHCMANCNATNAGSGGRSAAKVISFFRTNVWGHWTEPDWKDDDKANKCGQQGGDCNKTCSQFVPQSSPGKPPFPPLVGYSIRPFLWNER